MTDDQQQKPPDSQPQHQEPKYQDELDVLAAVAEIEKKYGKQILTEEQRGKLRIEKKDSDAGNISLLSNKGRMRVADRVVKMVFGKLESQVPDLFVGKEWEELNKSDQVDAKRLIFSTIYGVSPEQLRLNLYKELGGTL